jgi:hypothetical protein
VHSDWIEHTGKLSHVQEYGCEVPEPQDLVTISQSRCSASDLSRMEAILASKLTSSSSQQVPPLPLTPLSFLRAMWEVSRVAAARYTSSQICTVFSVQLLIWVELYAVPAL